MILHIPHSSKSIPSKYTPLFSLLPEELDEELLRMTDAYTDELFIPLDKSHIDIETVIFHYSRLLVDVERFDDDSLEPMFNKGMGKFYTKSSDSCDLKSVNADIRLELQRLYDAHHQQLTEAVQKELTVFGSCLIVDCHSFPDSPLPFNDSESYARPDICIGTDSFHTSTSLVEKTKQYFEQAGYDVVINSPYSGSLVPMKFYGKDERVQSIMIEVNRRLYMDESTGERSADFRVHQRNLHQYVRIMNDDYSLRRQSKLYNQFERLCYLASKNNWCWKIGCSTCGCMYIRCALLDIAEDEALEFQRWIRFNKAPDRERIQKARNLSELEAEHAKRLIRVCAQANLRRISKISTHPDWLGYMGLVLYFVERMDVSYTRLSKSWIRQLIDMLPEGRSHRAEERFKEILAGDIELSWHNLQSFEYELSQLSTMRGSNI